MQQTDCNPRAPAAATPADAAGTRSRRQPAAAAAAGCVCICRGAAVGRPVGPLPTTACCKHRGCGSCTHRGLQGGISRSWTLPPQVCVGVGGVVGLCGCVVCVPACGWVFVLTSRLHVRGGCTVQCCCFGACSMHWMAACWLQEQQRQAAAAGSGVCELSHACCGLS